MSALAALAQGEAPRYSDQDMACFVVYAGAAMFGLPVEAVHAIFRIQSITPVPLGPPVVLGLVNLRGKIVTAISLERRLDLPPRAAPIAGQAYGVAIDAAGESYALIVDGVGDAMTCREAERTAPPSHVCETRARLTQAYYRIENGILPVLDIDALFDLGSRRARAEGHSEIRPRRNTTNGADT